jgi:citrate synthase
VTDRNRAVVQTMGEATRDSVTVRGLDLTEKLVGQVSFTDLFHLELTARLPVAAEREVLDAVLVALTEHGLTPTAVVARLTDLGAPGALQGAVAAGLLGGGDRFLGALDGTARLLQEWPDDVTDTEHADALVAGARARGERVPGLGHPTHTNGDPRTARLFAVADRVGLPGVARARFELVRAAAERAAGRPLPINVDGAAGVLLTEIGLPWWSARGVALVARAAGLVGHLADERAHPTATAIWAAAEASAPYRDPETGA